MDGIDRMQQDSASAEVLRADDGHFRQVYERAPIGIVLVDQSGKFVEVNPAFARMIGYDRTELIGMAVAQLTFPQDIAATRALIQDLLQRNPSCSDGSTCERQLIE